MVAEEVLVEAQDAVAEETGPYEMRECSGCLGDGHVYDDRAWVGHEQCSGTGRARTFMYAKARGGRRLRECEGCRGWYVGGDLFEVGDDHLTFFEGDELCGRCAAHHGVL